MRNYTELTTDEIASILTSIKADITYKTVAEMHNVNRRVVSKIALDNGIRKRKFVNRNVETRECDGYKPRGRNSHGQCEASPVKLSEKQLKTFLIPEYPTSWLFMDIEIVLMKFFRWMSAAKKSVLNLLFGPDKKKVNSSRGMMKNLTKDQIFQLVFAYKSNMPSKETQRYAMLSKTDETHAQQLRRLHGYIMTKDEYAGIKNPRDWFYRKAFYRMDFDDVADFFIVTKHPADTYESAVEWMFKNNYSCRTDFEIKSMF